MWSAEEGVEEDTLGLTVESAMSSLSTLLIERQKKLDRREAALNTAQEKFDADRSAVFGNTKPSDVLHLNVGGTKMAVLRRTLTSVEGSMLASRFSGRWDESIERDENGHFFIDQEFALFEPMVNYLRHKCNETEGYPMDSPYSRGRTQDFYRMVEYYGMTQGIFPTELNVAYNSLENVETLDMIGSLEVDAKDWCTFELSRCGHSRTISAFEVTLGSVQRIQVGWTFYTSDADTDNKFKFKGTSFGVGDVACSLAIDLARSCFLRDGIRTDMSGLEIKEGSVVRSENFGNKFFIDGRLVASADASDGGVQITGGSGWMNGDYWKFMRPALSIKGQMKISAIEYKD